MALRLPIYLDHNATTPVDPTVFEAMRPFFCETFGNAASNSHSFGWEAKRAVDHARDQVAALIHADPSGIIWTSGATESNNLAIKGACEALTGKGKHIITQPTEHKAVLDPFKRLEASGYEVTMLPVSASGLVSPDDLRAAIRADTVLVSIMWANNETGTVQPIRQIGKICRDRDVLFHTDATQAVGKVPIHVLTDGVDLLSMSAHKLYGPKGAGALYVRRRGKSVRLAPLFDGGGHQDNMRSGTLNVTGNVGLGAACELAMVTMQDEAVRLANLRDRLERGIMSQIDGVTINGEVKSRLPHVSNLSFAGVDGVMLLQSMDDVAVSSGSACTSANPEPSFVLMAMGMPTELAVASLRFSLGKSNGPEEVDYAVEKVAATVKSLRELRASLSR